MDFIIEVRFRLLSLLVFALSYFEFFFRFCLFSVVEYCDFILDRLSGDFFIGFYQLVCLIVRISDYM